MQKWSDQESLKKLLIDLVQHASVTGSDAEIALSEFIYYKLGELPYFQERGDLLEIHPMSDGRKFVTALVKNGQSKSKHTVVLLSHFDVVDVEDYGEWKNLAFRPAELTNLFKQAGNELPDAVLDDLKTKDEWLFGRGTMDMKAGVALHMSIIEQAASGEFDGNILMLTVPDEEVNSAGMISAVSVLLELEQKHDLEYKTCLNSEPVFSKYPGDENQYIYTGSIGKILPGFLCYGMETHVGDPFSGLNANYMVSELNREIELNVDYCEVVEGEITPAPTNLMQKDLKEEYSVQIPHIAVSLFNVLTMEKTVQAFSEKLLESARVVAKRIEKHVNSQAVRFADYQHFTPRNFEPRVLTYAELLRYAIEKYGEAEIGRRQSYIIANFKELGDRDLSTRLVSDLASLCKDQAPMIVLFYSPPFYPAISSKEHRVVQDVVGELIELGKEKGISFKKQCFFSGLSDLSFAGLQQPVETLSPLIENMPLFGKSYQLPITLLKQLNIPVMNFGPFGRDAHKWTERLNVSYSFGVFPELLEIAIKKLLSY